MSERRKIESGIAQLEGYLMGQAEISGARAEAEAFAGRMPWLTTAQREEVIRLYADSRIEVSRRVLRAVVERCAELRAEYTARYEMLRRRVMCAAVATALLIGALAAGVSSLLLPRVL